MWRGRDDRARVRLPDHSLPPLDLSPAQVATLIDNSCDPLDIVATLVDLAARGFLSIEEAAPGEWLVESDDLRFVRCEGAPPIERLKKHERMFLSALFDSQPPDIERGRRPANINPSEQPWNETALSLLHNKFYRHLPPLEAEIYESLKREGFYHADPKATREFFAVVGFLLLFGFLAVATLTANAGGSATLVMFPLGLALSGALWFLVAPWMPSRTVVGTLKADQSRRFIAWVRAVNPVSLGAMLTRDAALFERLLPYAIVLGVGETWAHKGEACGQWAPLWFRSHALDAQSVTGAATHLIGHLPHIEKTFASAPAPRAHPRDSHGNLIETGSF